MKYSFVLTRSPFDSIIANGPTYGVDVSYSSRPGLDVNIVNVDFTSLNNPLRILGHIYANDKSEVSLRYV